ncbi:MAG: hypothetical protein AB8F94_24685 [Saprospiraceae bacterium]
MKFTITTYLLLFSFLNISFAQDIDYRYLAEQVLQDPDERSVVIIEEAIKLYEKQQFALSFLEELKEMESIILAKDDFLKEAKNKYEDVQMENSLGLENSLSNKKITALKKKIDRLNDKADDSEQLSKAASFNQGLAQGLGNRDEAVRYNNIAVKHANDANFYIDQINELSKEYEFYRIQYNDKTDEVRRAEKKVYDKIVQIEKEYLGRIDDVRVSFIDKRGQIFKLYDKHSNDVLTKEKLAKKEEERKIAQQEVANMISEATSKNAKEVSYSNGYFDFKNTYELKQFIDSAPKYNLSKLSAGTENVGELNLKSDCNATYSKKTAMLENPEKCYSSLWLDNFPIKENTIDPYELVIDFSLGTDFQLSKNDSPMRFMLGNSPSGYTWLRIHKNGKCTISYRNKEGVVGIFETPEEEDVFLDKKNKLKFVLFPNGYFYLKLNGKEYQSLDLEKLVLIPTYGISNRLSFSTDIKIHALELNTF